MSVDRERLLVTGIIAVLTLTCMFPSFPPPTQAQSMSHEEEVVRNAYAKLSFMCELVPLFDTAFYGSSPDDPRGKDITLLQTAIANSCPVFSLSAFTTGPISEIANQPLNRFAVLPAVREQVLVVQPHGLSNDYLGNKTDWVGALFKWRESTTNMYDFQYDETVSQGIQTFLWSDDKGPITWTRYATYTVDVTLRGRSSGPHKATFWFGRDANGKAVTYASDPVTGGGIFHSLNNFSAYPGAYLYGSKEREVPVVAAWVRSHEMPSASCSEAARTLCCSQGRCGISQSDINRDLAAPLPPAKNGGGQ